MARRGVGSYAASGTVVLAATGFLTFALSETASRSVDGETLRAAFSSSGGLAVGSTVEIAGVKVGEVTSIELDRRTYLSDVRFSVRRQLRLPVDSSLAIQGGGLSGSAVLEVEPGTSAARFADGDVVVRTSPASSLEHEVGTFIFGTGGLSDTD